MPHAHLVRRLVQAGLSDVVARTYVRGLEEGVSGLSDLESEVLVDVGLAERDGERTHLQPPEAVMALWAHRHETSARILREISAPLQALYRVTGEGDEPAVQFLHGGESVLEAFSQVQRGARTRLRAMDRGPYRPSREPTPCAAQLQAMSAGVEYFVIYSADVVEDPEHRAEVDAAVRAGETARVLPGVPMKIVLADDAVGLIVRVTPAGQIEGFLVQPSLLLDTLMGFFDSLWQLAIPLRAGEGGEARDEESTILRGLAVGLTDDAIARDLGVSERTVARRIARLQQTMAARSRFQLGLQAERRGLV